MKRLRFLGGSLKCLRDLPADVRQDAGYQLDKFNAASNPMISNRCRRSARGVEEIRIRNETGAYRVIHSARLAAAVYVLHVFQKKTQVTSSRDIEIARDRFVQLMRDGI